MSKYRYLVKIPLIFKSGKKMLFLYHILTPKGQSVPQKHISELSVAQLTMKIFVTALGSHEEIADISISDFLLYKNFFEKFFVFILNDVKQFVNLHQKNILS